MHPLPGKNVPTSGEVCPGVCRVRYFEPGGRVSLPGLQLQKANARVGKSQGPLPGKKGPRSQFTIHTFVLQYEFAGYGWRQYSKLTWPLLLITVESAGEGIIREALKLELNNQYLPCKENVCNDCTTQGRS